MLEELFFVWKCFIITNLCLKVGLRFKYFKLLTKKGYKVSKEEKQNIFLSVIDENLILSFIPFLQVLDILNEFHTYKEEKYCLLRRLEFDCENVKKHQKDLEKNYEKHDNLDNKLEDCMANELSEIEVRKANLIRLKEIILAYQNQKVSNQNLEVETSDKTKKLNFLK